MTGFYRPDTVEEAVKFLRENPRAAVLSGGTDLIIAVKEGKRRPDAYIDITGIREMREIRVEKGRIFLGAAVTFSEAERNPQLRQFCPLLCRAAAAVGSPQIRSRGTFGGNTANASPAADTVPALTVLEAEAEIAGPDGRRRIKIEELIIGSGKTGLKRTECITGFHIVLPPGDTRYGYGKIGRRNALAISRLNGACLMREENGIVREARLCIGAATDHPARCSGAEKILTGRRPDPDLWAQAGRAVRDFLLAETGLRSSSAYKLQAAEEFSGRLLKNTWEGRQ